MKKIFACIFVMLLSFTAFSTVKADNFIAKNNDTNVEFETLTEAIEKSKEGEEIVLLTDVKENVKINKNIILNLNGKSLTTADIKNSIITVSITDKGTLIIKNGTITGANAQTDGGALYITNSSTIKIDNVTFSNNKGINGGAIKSYGGHIIISNGSKFINNSLQKYGNGGAMQIAATVGNSLVEISNTTFEGNSSMMGGAISISSNNPDYTAKLVVKNSKFNKNVASVSGGAIHTSGRYTFYDIENVTFDGNKAKTYGGAIYATEAARNGETTAIKNSKFYSNQANFGGAIYLNGTGETPGNVITRSFILDEKTEVINNKATNGGGALYLTSDSSTTTKVFVNGELYNNTAKNYADDIYSVGKKVELHLTNVKENTYLSDCEHKIDGWYVDEKGNRWNGHDLDKLNTVLVKELTLTGVQNLKAAHKGVSKVNAIYVDNFGNTLNETITSTGFIGEDYKTSALDITDYKLIEIKGNENGKYADEEITVTYVYEFDGGKGQGEPDLKDPDIPITGINDGYVTEMFTLLSLISLVVLKKIKKAQ